MRFAAKIARVNWPQDEILPNTVVAGSRLETTPFFKREEQMCISNDYISAKQYITCSANIRRTGETFAACAIYWVIFKEYGEVRRTSFQ